MPIPSSSSILVIGGTGFIGSHLAEALVQRGFNLTLPTRRRDKVKESLIPLPGVSVVDADVHDVETLTQLAAGHAAVINLVGILHGSESAFQQAHVALTEKIIIACQRNGISRYLHMSAIGADTVGASNYQKTKGLAEVRVATSGLDFVIYRPSLVFGDGRCFLSLFANLLQFAPFVPLAGAQCQMQPVWVGDVVEAFAAGLVRDDLLGKTISLVGPRIYTLQQLVEYIGDTAGTPRAVFPIPDGIARLQAAIFGLLPNPPLSNDNLDSLKVDNVDTNGFSPLLGWTPTALEAIAPAVLANKTTRARYLDYRRHAGR